jgi:glycosyltransferase involved in cell wall biosynthesis
MQIFDSYLKKHAGFPPLIPEKPEETLTCCVMIPSYREPELFQTLESLISAVPPSFPTEVIVVVNSPEGASTEAKEINQQTIRQFHSWKQHVPTGKISFHLVHVPELKKKWAGAGWARKIGMDEAIRRFNQAGTEDGIIVSLDADCRVSPNYFTAIEKAFQSCPKCQLFTLGFEHDLQEPHLDAKLCEGITRYELYMRYYRHAMQLSGYPNAIYTIGSAFAVRAGAYVKQGGMNRKKAGEDFYFLHKVVQLGSFGEINEALVFPGIRTSDRVPFGTGPKLAQFLSGEDSMETTYSFQAFTDLHPFFSNINKFYKLNQQQLTETIEEFTPSLRRFLHQSESIDAILELQANCSGETTFVKRFFHRFNAFWILKYLNFVHDTTYQPESLLNAAKQLLNKKGIKTSVSFDYSTFLHIFRNLDYPNHI